MLLEARLEARLEAPPGGPTWRPNVESPRGGPTWRPHLEGPPGGPTLRANLEARLEPHLGACLEARPEEAVRAVTSPTLGPTQHGVRRRARCPVRLAVYPWPYLIFPSERAIYPSIRGAPRADPCRPGPPATFGSVSTATRTSRPSWISVGRTALLLHAATFAARVEDEDVVAVLGEDQPARHTSP